MVIHYLWLAVPHSSDVQDRMAGRVRRAHSVRAMAQNDSVSR